MKVLCVAEKPSISKSITQILSGGRFEAVRLPRSFLQVTNSRLKAATAIPLCPRPGTLMLAV